MTAQFAAMKIDVLDHGYIRFIEAWGSGDNGLMEAGIIEAARQSTQKSFKGWGPTHAPNCGYIGMPDDPQRGCTCGGKQPGDEKLLKYLYDNKHSTPFEFAGLVIEVQAPIFVFREWHRHRTQSYNEMSARYEPLPDLNYIPTVERLMLNNKANKQASTIKNAEELTVEKANFFQKRLAGMYGFQEDMYQDSLKDGVPKELARVMLPVGRYSRMRASANLRNWLQFMTLRSDKNPNAMWEIRQYANALGIILETLFPKTMELFNAN